MSSVGKRHAMDQVLSHETVPIPARPADADGMYPQERHSPPSDGSDRMPGSERGLLPSLGVFTKAGFALVISLRLGSSGRSTCEFSTLLGDFLPHNSQIHRKHL